MSGLPQPFTWELRKLAGKGNEEKPSNANDVAQNHRSILLNRWETEFGGNSQDELKQMGAEDNDNAEGHIHSELWEGWYAQQRLWSYWLPHSDSQPPLPVEHKSRGDGDGTTMPSRNPRLSQADTNELRAEQAAMALYQYVERNWSWLLQKCEPYASFGPNGEVLMSETYLATSVLDLVKQRSLSPTVLQNKLLELLGFVAVEFVGELVTHREAVSKISVGSSSSRLPRGKSKGGGAVSSQITIRSQRDIDARKQARKEARRLHKQNQRHQQGQGDNDSSTLSGAGWKKQMNDQRVSTHMGDFIALEPKNRKQRYKLDEKKLQAQATALDYLHDLSGSYQGYQVGLPRKLPAGSIVEKRSSIKAKKNVLDYTECYVPPPKRPEKNEEKESSNLVNISALPKWAHRAFKGCKSLNTVQSKVYPCAFLTSENMLVCAPTGAGKTNCAILTVLRELSFHLDYSGDRIDPDEVFKIVYVAPMKALAQEVVRKFSGRLSYLGVEVRELTGDQQLTKGQIARTHILVTTPEKWDVMTRKSGHHSLMSSVALLIIDEVHLLHEDRGPVLEVLVARTQRHMEQTQSPTRLVALSATLPNYADVGVFLGVNPEEGLFYFNQSYRPVPLESWFIGVHPYKKPKSEKGDKSNKKQKGGLRGFAYVKDKMNEIAYQKAIEALQKGHQVMVFVHSRADTFKTAMYFKQFSEERGESHLLIPSGNANSGGSEDGSNSFQLFRKRVSRCKDKNLQQVANFGMGIHHGGMPKPDRNFVEASFAKGQMQVLFCTATLAWGVNLPAHTVILKGTQIYDPKKGGWTHIGMQDVLQVFGRAGRPQFDSTGEAVLITQYDQLGTYLQWITNQMPIESQFASALIDHLNAEIVLGTVATLSEAMRWLQYTYLYIRMLRNWHVYGVTAEMRRDDPNLVQKRRELLQTAIDKLKVAHMVKFDAKSGVLMSTNVGRIASHFYIKYESMTTFEKALSYKPKSTSGMAFNEQELNAIYRLSGRKLSAALLHLIASSGEFEQLKTRDTEVRELAVLRRRYCPIPVVGVSNELGAGMSESSRNVATKALASHLNAQSKSARAPTGTTTSTLAEISQEEAVGVSTEGKQGSSSSFAIKANVLMQTYISRGYVDSATLGSDMYYVQQNVGRIARALMELSLRKGMPSVFLALLRICVQIEKRAWHFDHALKQFCPPLKLETVHNLASKGDLLSVPNILDMTVSELAASVRRGKPLASQIMRYASHIPWLHVDYTLHPLTPEVLQIQLVLSPDFTWSSGIHGAAQPFYIWLEDQSGTRIYHHEFVLVPHKRRLWAAGLTPASNSKQSQKSVSVEKESKTVEMHVTFTIPLSQPPPNQLVLRILSDRFLGSEQTIPISLNDTVLPLPSSQSQMYAHIPTHTPLLNLHPLSIEALMHPTAVAVYKRKFSHFNPIQTQVFHCAYHTDENLLLGAPTGSGKTLIAELCILRMLRRFSPSGGDGKRGKRAIKPKCVYIAPLKALTRERMKVWGSRSRRKHRIESKSQDKLAGLSMPQALGLKVVELTGDSGPNAQIHDADIIVTTPEKWDGICRNWSQRSYVSAVRLLVIDEIHLLGGDRGPVLECIISRMRYISEVSKSVDGDSTKSVRFVGLSTALSNPKDLAAWLGVDMYKGLFNFPSKVRPVPLDIYIDGFPGKHYCPRMATMNKPCYRAIQTHSPTKPVLIFVASRRQTRLTAFDLIAYATQDLTPHRFRNSPSLKTFEEIVRVMRYKSPADLKSENVALFLDNEQGGDARMQFLLRNVKDPNLKHCLSFGVGIHHAGLSKQDRNLVECLFFRNVVKVLVCTATLAWGVNFPAHLVIVKGTEFYDAKQSRYVDMSMTDVLQMIGRAGRPQFDQHAYACVFVHQPKKSYYQHFLHKPFPVESHLHASCVDHMCADICNGIIKDKESVLGWFTWTFLYRRVIENPGFYGLADRDDVTVANYFIKLAERSIKELYMSGCLEINSSGDKDAPQGIFGQDGGSLFVSKRQRRKTRRDARLSNAKGDRGRAMMKLGESKSGGGPNYLVQDGSGDTIPLTSPNYALSATYLGRICSYYYLSHATMRMFVERLEGEFDPEMLGRLDQSTQLGDSLITGLWRLVCDTPEYDEMPVRHNEDTINQEICEQSGGAGAEITCAVELPSFNQQQSCKNKKKGNNLLWQLCARDRYDSPHTKTFLLLQMHLLQMPLPISDYGTDLKSFLDQAPRILQALLDVCAWNGWMALTFACIHSLQTLIQTGSPADSGLWQLPHMSVSIIRAIREAHTWKASEGNPSLTTPNNKGKGDWKQEDKRILVRYPQVNNLPELLSFFYWTRTGRRDAIWQQYLSDVGLTRRQQRAEFTVILRRLPVLNISMQASLSVQCPSEKDDGSVSTLRSEPIRVNGGGMQIVLDDALHSQTSDKVSQSCRSSGVEVTLASAAKKPGRKGGIQQVFVGAQLDSGEGKTEQDNAGDFSVALDLRVHVRRESLDTNMEVYAPYYRRNTTEGWYVLVEKRDANLHPEAVGELCALTRTRLRPVSRQKSGRGKPSTTVKIQIDCPEEPGIHSYRIHLCPDGYRELDQMLDFTVEVKEGKGGSEIVSNML